MDLYLEEKLAVWASRTAYHRSRALEDFLAFLWKEERELGAEAVRAFVAEAHQRLTRKGHPWAPATLYSLLSAVRCWLRWAFRRGQLLQDLAGLMSLRSVSSLPRALSEAELLQLIEKGARAGELHSRDRALLELLYGTGLRASELCRLELEDVDLREGLLYVRRSKGGKERIVPFGEQVRKALLAYLREGPPARAGPLFLSQRGQALSRDTVTKTVARAGQRAGLTRAVSPHRLRHSYATHLLRHGASVRAVQALLGHASLASTQIYLEVELSDLARMVEKSHPRG